MKRCADPAAAVAATRCRSLAGSSSIGWSNVKGVDMKRNLIVLAMFAALAAPAGVAQAKGCIKGAVVGGVAGHVAGHHGVVGAAAGCVIGHHAAKVKAKKDKEQRAQAARHRNDSNMHDRTTREPQTTSF
jgi:hypothetical protein